MKCETFHCFLQFSVYMWNDEEEYFTEGSNRYRELKETVKNGEHNVHFHSDAETFFW